jgi:hypothetical protein
VSSPLDGIVRTRIREFLVSEVLCSQPVAEGGRGL